MIPRHPEANRKDLLTVRELSVSFETRDGKVRAVNDVSFSHEAGAAGRVGRREERHVPGHHHRAVVHLVAPVHAARCHLIG